MGGTVAVLLVSHDGGRWLPQVLDRLQGQTCAPDRVVAVDTGSRDGSVELLKESLGAAAVLVADRSTTYPAAVRRGLELLGPVDDGDWVWLLHDDSAPAPDALERLLEARSTGADLLGPKLREWPSLRRLLEVGVTITGTGQRETGLERGEHDQGQHDEPRDVLAVNTAGMLVRRAVLERLGLDDRVPVVHTDLDLGWRAARAGLRVRTVPDAVVFHAEASRTGTRGPDLSRARRRRTEREAALHTVLANCAPVATPFVAVRLMLGGLLRALGLLLVRAPGEAWAELRAAAAVLGRPDRVLAARRVRKGTAVVDPRSVRPLLAPAWLPYRNGLDELSGIGAALVAEAGARTGTPQGASWWGRWRRSPALAVLILMTLVSLLAGRELIGAGQLAGGALLPAPDSATDWWRLYLSPTHDVATGSSVTAPAYVLPMALLATVLLGSADAAVTLLVLAAVPLAALGAHRFLGRICGSPTLSAWGGVCYGLLLATSGAVAQGRLGTLAAGAVLPWLALSASGLVGSSDDRRRRAAWRTGLWLALATAFAPLTWAIAAVVAIGAVAARAGDRLTSRLLLLPLGVALLLLLPWWVLVWPDRSWSAFLLEAGLPASPLVGQLGPLDVLAARAGAAGSAPAWIALGTAVVAALALLRRATRDRVAVCWAVALVGLAATWLASAAPVEDPVGQGSVLVWAGLPLLVAHGAWLAAAALAGAGLRSRLSGRAFGWRQPVGVAVVLAALVLPLCGTTWWIGHGSGDPVARTSGDTVPAYLDASADRDPAEGTLVLRGTATGGLSAEIRRGGPLAIGQDAVLPDASDQQGLLATVADGLTAPEASVAPRLAAEGVAFVLAPAPVDPAVAAALDAAPGLTSASAGTPDSRAWRLEEPPTLPSTAAGAGGRWRWLLLVLQGLGLVAVVVLAAPTRRRPL